MLPEWFFISVVVLLGLVIGSFLNVVIYRLRTGRSLNNRSHCLSCGHMLRWYELFPVVSYLFLKGRCRYCSSFIPYRYVLVESLTAASFLLAYLKADNLLLLLLLGVFMSILIVILFYDLQHLIIPDEMSLAAALVAIMIVAIEAMAWTPSVFELLSLTVMPIFSGVIVALSYASLWYFSAGRWFGLGDAKLSFSLGVLVGMEGLFSLVTLSFWIGAIISLLLILGQRLSTSFFFRKGMSFWPRVRMKSEVPFAPFMIAAFFAVYFFEADVLGFVERMILLFL